MKRTSARSKGAGQAKDPAPNTELVRVEFTHPKALNVCIAGTFNEWHPGATEMIGLGNGRWVKDLTLPPGVYEYRFVVDGEWMEDPTALEKAANPFGGVNSVLRVPAGGGRNGAPRDRGS